MNKGYWPNWLQSRQKLIKYLRHDFRRQIICGWAGLCLVILTSCALPQVSAQERLFLNVNLELLDVATLPKQTFAATPVGGLSALAYDANRDVFYALSDDRGHLAAPRFYTLAMPIDTTAADAPRIGTVQVTQVTFLKDSEGNVYERDRLDPEGLVLSPRRTLFITSEGVAASESPPRLHEYDLQTGVLLTEFRLPERFVPHSSADGTTPPQGVRSNEGFESLTLNPTSSAGAYEPFRLFLATESALAQDFDENPANPLKGRFLHYLMGPEQSTFIAEYAYPLDLEPTGAITNGLTELLAVDQGGHFLALERVYGIRSFEVKLFQLATGGATDISTQPRIASLEGVNPIQKQLLLDFATLDAPVERVDNLEGMALGPPLPDGSPTLWIISDDNFSAEQTTQVWLFKLAIA